MMKEERGHSRQVLACVLGISLSMFLQAVGFATPGWQYLDGNLTENIHIKRHIGLWFRIVCQQNDSSICETERMPILGRETKDDSPMLEYQIETCLGLVFCLAALISGIAYHQCGRNKTPSLLMICVFTSVVSGVLALIAAGKMGDANLRAYYKERDVGFSIIQFPYSLFITGIGGVINCVVAILLIIQFHIHTRNGWLSGEVKSYTSLQMRGNINNGYQEPWTSSADTMRRLQEKMSTGSSNTSVDASPYAVGGVAISGNQATDRTQYVTGTDRTHYAPANTDRTHYPPASTDRTQYAPANTDRTHYTPANTDRTHYSPASTDKTHYAPPNTDRTHYAPPNTDGTHYAPPNSDRTHYAPPNTDKTHYAPVNTDRKHYAPANTGRTHYAPAITDETHYAPTNTQKVQYAPASAEITNHPLITTAKVQYGPTNTYKTSYAPAQTNKTQNKPAKVYEKPVVNNRS